MGNEKFANKDHAKISESTVQHGLLYFPQLTESTVNNISQTVEPHNDYFSLSFILGFPVAGAHLVNIHAAIVDENGCLWKTGPKVSLQVKSYDDAIQRQQTKMASRPSYSQLFTT